MAFQRFLLILPFLHVHSFTTNRRPTPPCSPPRHTLHATPVQGIVSSLTSLSNLFALSSSRRPTTSPTEQPIAASPRYPPVTPMELLDRIRDDYVERNYLWTGKLDTSSFTANCKFTDPTLSFEGLDKYVENVGNLVPVVEFLLGWERASESKLWNIVLNEEEGYIQTRWNMVGELNRLPWRPRIDVVGRTKFWYERDDKEDREDDGREAVRVYFYEEEWEIPAGLALLQLVTPAGTISNSTAIK